MKVGAVVLAKNEGHRILDCLKMIQYYTDNILVVDGASTDETREKAKQIANSIIINGSRDFGAVRTQAHEVLMSQGCNYALHVDVDEVWDNVFLRYMKMIIGAFHEIRCFKFPRINLPDRKNYPDYQPRLLMIKDLKWIGETHEVPCDVETKERVDRLSCITLDPYPIIHMERAGHKEERTWWKEDYR